VTAPVLSARNLVAGYDGSTVVDDVSFEVAAGETLLVMGRNGVGKTTLMETIMGLTRVLSGSILVDGREVTSASPYRRSKLGIAWVPQQREIFPSLTVEETLAVVRREGTWTIDRVYDLFPRLRQRRRNYGLQLSGGEQQMLALGRALMTNPRVLLLDEPVEGLAPIITAEMIAAIDRMRREDDMAILLVEQKYQLAFPVSNRVLVLDNGRVVLETGCDAFRDDPGALERYLAPA